MGRAFRRELLRAVRLRLRHPGPPGAAAGRAAFRVSRPALRLRGRAAVGLRRPAPIRSRPVGTRWRCRPPISAAWPSRWRSCWEVLTVASKRNLTTETRRARRRAGEGKGTLVFDRAQADASLRILLRLRVARRPNGVAVHPAQGIALGTLPPFASPARPNGPTVGPRNHWPVRPTHDDHRISMFPRALPWAGRSAGPSARGRCAMFGKTQPIWCASRRSGFKLPPSDETPGTCREKPKVRQNGQRRASGRGLTLCFRRQAQANQRACNSIVTSRLAGPTSTVKPDVSGLPYFAGISKGVLVCMQL